MKYNKKNFAYENARQFIYDKSKYLHEYVENMVAKTSMMFHYENLPKETPKRILERMLMLDGYCIFTKHDDRFVLLQGGLGGELNEYYEYTKCIVSNPFLKLEKEYTLNEDCVLIRNDSNMNGLTPILLKYGVLCGDCEMSINMLTNILRTQFIITAGDNKGKESAGKYINDLINGKFATIGDNAFTENIKIHDMNINGNYIQSFIELNQYLRATAYNEIGLDANYNMKRERLSESEVDLNTSILIPLSENMLECRKNAVDMINEKYGLNIQVELSSVWKMQKETVDNAIKQVETETKEETELSDTDTETETEQTAEQETTAETEQTTETETEKEETENRG